MTWKVLITARGVTEAGARAQELLRTAGCELVLPPKPGPLSADDLIRQLNGIDAVLASLDQYTATVLSSPAAQHLKIIARWGVGYDSVDIPAATQNGIVVTYTPGLLDEAVADYTFALLIALARRVGDAHVSFRQGEWRPLWGHDVGGATLGIIGFGRIGRAVARRARGFNMRLLVHTPHPPPAADWPGVQFVPLDTLLAESDFVSLLAALTPQSRGLIGEAQLRRMKPSAHLINTGRGALVDEAALGRALRGGWIAGAALDVFVREPLPTDHPLRSTPNLLLSPHQSSYGRATGERVSVAAAQALIELMNGRRPENVLNPDVFDSPALRAKPAG